MATDKVLIDVALLEQIEQSLGSFCSDMGWSDEDMVVLDNVSAAIASGIKTVDTDAGIAESVAVIRQIMRFIKDHSPKGFCPSLAEQRVNARLDMIVSATAQQPHTVKLPTTADEAELMAKLGVMWLEQNAPSRLNATTPPNVERLVAINAELVEVLKSYDGNRAIDVWDESYPGSKEWELKRCAVLAKVEGGQS